MKKSLVLVFLVLILIVGGLAYYNLGQEKVCVGNQCFEVEVADSQEERGRGLMYRDSLANDKGMFFVFKNSERHDFWMKNTEIPLDIIWINSDMEIVHMEHNVQPCETENCQTYSPDESSMYVLEINSGLSEEYGIEEGDKVETSNVF